MVVAARERLLAREDASDPRRADAALASQRHVQPGRSAAPRVASAGLSRRVVDMVLDEPARRQRETGGISHVVVAVVDQGSQHSG